MEEAQYFQAHAQPEPIIIFKASHLSAIGRPCTFIGHEDKDWKVGQNIENGITLEVLLDQLSNIAIQGWVINRVHCTHSLSLQRLYIASPRILLGIVLILFKLSLLTFAQSYCAVC